MSETIESTMGESVKILPKPEFQKTAYIKSMQEYEKLYKESIEDRDGFWSKMAGNLTWSKKWDRVYYWDPKKAECRWFEGGKMNASYVCLDQQVKAGLGGKVAFLFEADETADSRKITYGELLRDVCRFANVLKKNGIRKGDRVILYLPMIPELPVAMLACARIGAVHSVVFGGFSSESLKDRITGCGAKMVVTSNVSMRGGKKIPLKNNADKALEQCPSVEKLIVVKRAEAETAMKPGRDLWWHEEVAAKDIRDECKAEDMDAEDPLYILYTSGTTGKPKGVLHTIGGYMVYVYLSFKYIFDYHDKDVFWCTADIGWVTGHSYIVYGPLANGATEVLFEGTPFYPEPDRFWKVVDKYKVTIFYTAPTAIRAIAKYGDEWVKKNDLSSLRLLGSVGEPINPEAWLWYYRVVGKERCPVVDTWWQTETGGILITPLPGAMTLKPGSASRPFFGIKPDVLDEKGNKVKAHQGGYLVIREPWPGMMRTVYGHHERFIETYFRQYPGIYLAGDSARIDDDGDYWLMGRIDDVIKVSGHRIGTAEVESALVSHKGVAEAAVVPIPHEVKGQAIYVFVVLKDGFDKSDALKTELVKHVGEVMGPIAKPEKIQFAEGLPKTRSGKIMRRILRKIAEGASEVGDTTTLADPTVVDRLISERQ